MGVRRVERVEVAKKICFLMAILKKNQIIFFPFSSSCVIKPGMFFLIQKLKFLSLLIEIDVFSMSELYTISEVTEAGRSKDHVVS